MRDVITVDGLAGSGKSALARALAKKLGFCHLNSGLVYRLVAYLTLEKGLDPLCASDVLEAMENRRIEFGQAADGSSQILVDGVMHANELQEPHISEASSLVARHQLVRDKVLSLQQEAYLPRGVVAEGRDMGTVVFPDAKVKFFVVGSLEVRATRRYEQLRAAGEDVSVQEVREALQQRDERDASSNVGTMRQAKGSVVIDNSTKGFSDVVDEMLNFIE